MSCNGVHDVLFRNLFAGKLADFRPVAQHNDALRIAREAVVNILKHADASRVAVRLEYAARLLILEVVDDGGGLTSGAAEVAASDGHLGLAGMRDRAHRAGGGVEIASQPGPGTTVRVTLPIE